MALISNSGSVAREFIVSDGAARAWTIELRDTSELKEKVDLSRYVDDEIVNPATLVVVNQFPKAGEEVPLGTPVTLTFMSKDSIRVNDIADLSDSIRTKYGNENVKRITDDIQSSEEVITILDDKKSYSDMNPTERDALIGYSLEKGLAEAGSSDESYQAIYNDLLFIHNI